MSDGCVLYYITDRKSLAVDEATRRIRLLDRISEAASHGVDYIQLREKDLTIRELESLALEAMRVIVGLSSGDRPLRTALLINSRTDVALARAVQGVHLTAGDVTPADVRASWGRGAGLTRPAQLLPQEKLSRDPIVAVSCHSVEEVAQAASRGATFAVFAPVFEKKDAPEVPAAGLDALREACRAPIPVLALGGVTLENAEACLQAGAAGIAAIRLFQENRIGAIVRQMRGR